MREVGKKSRKITLAEGKEREWGRGIVGMCRDIVDVGHTKAG